MKMRVAMKRFEGKQFAMVPAKELIGKSVTDFLLDEIKPTVVAVFDDEKDPQHPIFLLTNCHHQVAKYRERGSVIFEAIEIKQLFSSVVVPQVVVEAFPEGEFYAVQKQEVDTK